MRRGRVGYAIPWEDEYVGRMRRGRARCWEDVEGKGRMLGG